MNISPGPEALRPSAPMKLYTAGIIITPARIAIIVSKISIRPTDFEIFSSSLTYDPYATMIPIATDKL